jgi:hypothetical protein
MYTTSKLHIPRIVQCVAYVINKSTENGGPEQLLEEHRRIFQKAMEDLKTRGSEVNCPD